MKQPVECEWKLMFCEKCQKLGHKCIETPQKKNIKKWKPKHTQLDMQRKISIL